MRIKRIQTVWQGNKQHLVVARAKRAAMIAAGAATWNRQKGLTKSGTANLRGNCAAQLTTDLKVLADRLGRCPTEKEVDRAGICYGAVRHRFGTIQKALATIGEKLEHKKGQPRWYTND